MNENAVERISNEAEWYKARRKFMGAPPVGTPQAEAEAWADRTMAELLVDAVVDVGYAVKMGTTIERAQARREILAATGRANKEAPAAHTQPLIVLNFDPSKLPFVQKQPEVVSGETVKVIASGEKDE